MSTRTRELHCCSKTRWQPTYRREEYRVGDELDLLTDFEEDLILEPGVWEVGDQYKLCVCNVPVAAVC